MELPVDAHRCLNKAVLDHVLAAFPDLRAARTGLYCG
jgi:hypothetical protein